MVFIHSIIQVRMSILLDILPTDVLILIVNVWLDDCMKDLCSLDAAIVNKELRMRYILAGCLTMNKKEGFIKQIHIRTDENLMAVYKWKEERGLDIKRIFFKQRNDEHDLYLPYLGTLFPHLQEIKLCECDIKLHHIFFASLSHLRKLILDCCRIVARKEVVHNPYLHNPLLTNIEELQLFDIDDDINDDNSKGEFKQDEVYLWIAKCCPKVKICSMCNCITVSYMTAIQMMKQWPLLKEFKLTVPVLDQSVSYGDLDLPNQLVSTMRKANLESITLDICLDCYTRNEDAKYFLDILLNVCNVTELRSLVLFINDWPAEYLQRLLQSIPNMHQMNHITLHFDINYNFMGTSELLYAVLNHCHTLETLQLIGPSVITVEDNIMFFQAIATPNHLHLAHLASLQLEAMYLSNENINILCNSVYAKQLTSLRLKKLHGVPFETYQQLFSSFSQLKSFELVLNRRLVYYQGNDKMQKDYYKRLCSVLNPLFNGSCAFSNTLQSLTVSACCYDTSQWKDKQFKEEMFQDNVIPHWKFPFPNLQSCHVQLRIRDFPIATLMTKRLLVNCPALHTLHLKVMENKRTIKFTQQREMIRRMRESYL